MLANASNVQQSKVTNPLLYNIMNSCMRKIKSAIENPKCQYVSFDVFDTLIVRPFFNPTDLFLLLNDYVLSLLNTMMFPPLIS